MSIKLSKELLVLHLFRGSSSCAFLFFTVKVNNGSDESNRFSARNSSSSASELVGKYPLQPSSLLLSLAGDGDDFNEDDVDDAQLSPGEVLLSGMLLLIEFELTPNVKLMAAGLPH